jgi:4-amino-4-deoxy-L-arabinose transferase-like glycosyltransferase
METVKANTRRPTELLNLYSRNPVANSTALATLLACVVLLPLLGHKPLTNWDEGIYAEISREMTLNGSLIPHWNYHPWFEKPPLMLWITTLFFKLFGVHEFWARAGSALSGVAIVALVHGWLVRAKDTLAAWLSTLMLLGTFGFLHVCRVGEMDVLLSLGCCIALCGFTQIQQQRPAGWYLVWVGFAIATMTKGAASIVLVLTALILLLIERWPRNTFGRSFWSGLALCAVIVLPWHLVMWHLFGKAFLNDYLGFHVLTRATHQIEDHKSHWWFYLEVVLVSAAPCVLLYPVAIVHGLRRSSLRAWAVFAIVVLGFFTLIQTRLPHYIAPAYPALSLLAAVFLAQWIRERQRNSRLSRTSFWAIASSAAVLICVVSATLTAAPRGRLHQAKVSTDTVSAEKESIVLLRNVFSSPPEVPGPLLVWWEGDARSIATSVFYAKRPVQQVQLHPLQAGVPTDKYLFKPETLRDAVPAPRIILLDSYLVAQIPPDLSYKRIAAGRWMEVGLIQPR